MNQFVPQLMLGNPLDGSSGPPDYKPLWNQRKTWVFGAQYFFEIFNATKNATQGNAATGTTYVLLYQHLAHTCTSCTPAPLALTHLGSYSLYPQLHLIYTHASSAHMHLIVTRLKSTADQQSVHRSNEFELTQCIFLYLFTSTLEVSSLI